MLQQTNTFRLWLGLRAFFSISAFVVRTATTTDDQSIKLFSLVNLDPAVASRQIGKANTGPEKQMNRSMDWIQRLTGPQYILSNQVKMLENVRTEHFQY